MLEVNHAYTDTRLRCVVQIIVILLSGIGKIDKIVCRGHSLANINDAKLEDYIFVHLLAHDLRFLQSCSVLKDRLSHCDILALAPVLKSRPGTSKLLLVQAVLCRRNISLGLGFNTKLSQLTLECLFL